MTVRDIANFLEEWAPTWVAWDRDNVGLQIGDWNQSVKKILLTLDVTEEVVTEAVKKGSNLIISHHPLLFKPAASITTSDATGRMLLALAQNRVSLYSAHTNLDFSKDGVSFALARKLGLENIRFLSPLRDNLAKIIVFVPDSHIETVLHTMAKAGAGVIGEYSHCAYQTKGKGTFKGSADSTPFIGKAGSFETAEEVRLEMISPRARLPEVIQAMRSVHPYEEVAYDIYHLENENPNYGMGAIGKLPQEQSLRAFLSSVKSMLSAAMVKYTGDLNRKIQHVAVCGGSGSDLLKIARSAGADVFITADVRYHSFYEADDRICLVDAGHWETEYAILDIIAEKLGAFAKSSKKELTINVSKKSTNPVKAF